MKYRLKTGILDFVLLSFCVLLSSCRDEVKKYEKPSEVASVLKDLEPWRASTNYTHTGWKKLVEVARCVQRSDPKTVADGLDLFEKGISTNFQGTYEEESKPFLLLRMVFDLPEKAPATDRVSFKGWRRFESDVNSDGSVNLGWPLSWNEKTPYLTAECRGSLGQPYKAREEFDYLSAKYSFRDLDRVKLE